MSVVGINFLVMNKYFLISLMSSVVFILSGCATPQVHGNLRIQTIPELNKITTVEIGQTIISRAFVIVTPAIRVLNETIDPISPTPIPSGLFTLSKKDDKGSYYDSGKKLERSDWELIPHVFMYKAIERAATGQKVGSIGVFIPHDTSKPAVGYIADGDTKGTVPILNIQNTTKEEWSEGSFKRDLVYAGISKNIITILYREYKDNIARPAFSQEIKYDLDEGKIIGYQGSRFEIINANNTGITFKVLKEIN